QIQHATTHADVSTPCLHDALPIYLFNSIFFNITNGKVTTFFATHSHLTIRLQNNRRKGHKAKIMLIKTKLLDLLSHSLCLKGPFFKLPTGHPNPHLVDVNHEKTHDFIMKTRLLIRTSRKNFVWISMQEIITWIESTWTSWAKDQSISYEVLNVDDVDFSTVAKNALTSELIVVTCFNVPIARSLYLIRAQLQIQSPWCFYLHGLASFGLW